MDKRQADFLKKEFEEILEDQCASRSKELKKRVKMARLILRSGKRMITLQKADDKYGVD
ncbi:MAG: hypothetical protein WC862_00545 [Patescibacteria group bacterium]